ncbi:GUN4 domain-containing protein, partial [Cylindrospermopsis raciborskii]|uniref:GUN4 domain-containing protein n=1 Tax=Cylindrospermopsis raciborskii TaxID=77022 RepID=UPI001B3AD02A
EGWLRREDAEKFPCKELRSIDQLWLKYSRGKFGISVQQQIYQSLGGTKEYNRDVWRSMGDRVGWRQGGYWLSYSDQDFRAADRETDKVILAVANREREGWLRREDAEKFPALINICQLPNFDETLIFLAFSIPGTKTISG